MSRKEPYFRILINPSGRKFSLVSCFRYISVGYQQGGCRLWKWSKFFLLQGLSRYPQFTILGLKN